MKRIGINAFTLGVFEQGYFRGSNEKSFVIKLFGHTSQTLDKVAREIADEFEQEEVLIVDFSVNETRSIHGRLASE